MQSTPIVVTRQLPNREQRHRLQQFWANKYRNLRQRPLKFLVDEYEPRGRYFDFVEADSWFRIRGIPHEVSRPPVDDPEWNEGVPDPSEPWIPFKRWMMDIARTWTRPWPRESDLNVNEDTVGDLYRHDCSRMNFFRVMRYRISKHKSYAYWTQFARKHQHTALTDPFEFLDGRTPSDDVPRPERAVLHRATQRQSLIFLTLIGLNNYGIEDETINNTGVEALRHFIRSPAVMEPWLEFRHDYLRHHPNMSNPVWNTLQPALAIPDIQNLRRRVYLAPNPDKHNWSLMDHAVRFIMVLYHRGRQMAEAREREGLDDVHCPWEFYFTSEVSATDMEDRHWFGFSLLMFLVSSWQYNRLHPHPEYERVLTPALYTEYEPHNWEWEQIDGDVGMLDLSPTSKWECGDRIKTKFDFGRAYCSGFIGSWEQGQFYEDESDTPIDDNGYRVPLKRSLIRSYDEFEES
ncbi:hypothetical protein F5Y00DRAFT_256799 [Daldinia vernicosa]|uniref:uncharacterized protein n=1 Tax=Daldinia vernicosa TaxID=114800 RepID=UPI0020075244|nr:uncharacterized protein F5Y00DRAFT_256799 [Daldinia vernicosa]KAI0854306.1 hypothetical protein F5Y00DRAFT_256799 [Daldinia vernicosa]